MPIYEYECQKCKSHLERMQKISDKPLKKCPKCGGRLEKQWSSTSFQLKGSGWYVTDYAPNKAEAKEAKTDSKDASVKVDAKEVTEDKTAKKDSGAAADKATPKESTPSKKSGSSKPAPSSGD